MYIKNARTTDQRKNIFLADDDDGTLDVLTIAESDGYNVKTTTRGEDVLEIKSDFPDLILFDISMAELMQEIFAEF